MKKSWSIKLTNKLQTTGRRREGGWYYRFLIWAVRASWWWKGNLVTRELITTTFERSWIQELLLQMFLMMTPGHLMTASEQMKHAKPSFSSCIFFYFIFFIFVLSSMFPYTFLIICYCFSFLHCFNHDFTVHSFICSRYSYMCFHLSFLRFYYVVSAV